MDRETTTIPDKGNPPNGKTYCGLLPRLQLEHMPGFTLRKPDESMLSIFDSDMEAFNLGFSILLTDEGTWDSSISILPQSAYDSEMHNLTPDQLADLANQTNQLQKWLNDCAEVTQWVIDHRQALTSLAWNLPKQYPLNEPTNQGQTFQPESKNMNEDTDPIQERHS